MTMEQKKTFEPFERVIVKSKDKNSVWSCDMISLATDDAIYTFCRGEVELRYYDILPFAGNETLVGTNEMPCEVVELEKDEPCAMFGDEDDIRNCRADIRSFCYYSSSYFYDTGGMEYGYCVKLSQFNPNDMEETRKHILCVKNGKLVRANNV